MSKLLLYSWFATLEGHGRQKDDFRIQTTRAHDGPLTSEVGRISVGIGWHRELDVFVAFDAWTKRYTGTSSSVHIKRALINEAAAEGAASGGEKHDPRFAFRPGHAGQMVTWALPLAHQKTVALVPLEWNRDGDDAIIVGKVHASQPSSSLRVKDRILVVNQAHVVADDGLWKVRSIDAIEERTAKNRPRRFLRFTCRRVGKVGDLDPDFLKSLL